MSIEKVENKKSLQQEAADGETTMPTDHQATGIESHAAEPLRVVVGALAQMRYGTIQLTVHDGKVTQVDVTERQRFAG
ncbi:YezD family protein [Croceibacterium atlanticum]|nr:YezD family protein [Croceibacterium atlanticum]